MRRVRCTVFAAALAISSIAAIATATSAGAGKQFNTFTVVKVIDRTAPPGAEFKVEVDCGEGTTEVTFDEHGNPVPPGSNVFNVGAGRTCTATETGDGGASSVSYECALEFGPTDPDHTLTTCTHDNEAHFGDVLGDSATITVTNTFEEPPTTTTTAPPPTTTPVVVVSPTFTG